MIKSLLFHIGDPKTGTTSIQAAMQARAWQAPSLQLAVQPETNASALANSIHPGKGNAHKRQTHFARKAAWACEETADLGLVSAEFFAGVRPGALKAALHEFLPEQAAQTRILGYARGHAERFLSVYAQRVKTGSFSGTPDDFLPVALAAERSCYAPRFSMWRDTFGSAFKLRPFVRAHLFQQDVVQDFFNEVFEGEAFTLGETPRVNEALSVPELAAMRRVQAVLIARNVAPHLRLSFGGAMGRAMPGTAGRYSEKPQLTQAHGAALWARFSEDAAQTDRLFFDAPALTQAFEQALARAVGPAQDYDAQAYFPARRLRKMEQLAARVADCFEAMPGAWRADYQYLRGQRFVALKDQPDARKRQKNAKQVWALIDKLSKLMVQP